MSDELKGYKGQALEVLKKFKMRVWSEASLKNTRGDFHGVILPRSENDDDGHIVLKIPTGYNIGIAVETVEDIIKCKFRIQQISRVGRCLPNGFN